MKSLIVNSVENRISIGEKRTVCEFLEKHDNIYKKVENNINQFAKIANAQKHISNDLLKDFNQLLIEIVRLKKLEIERVNQIYELMTHGR
ncbi:hypothetical protein IMZ16_04115 [Cruoricaptor ignavus]|uniref:Mobilisation protein (MobC) n=1 Tax=Cruoricaptor ignavus TaxID=1118202 RepID=A0A7M1T421_9FLAO|nr:hypothetical protein [Cruoricaptor ignavus]QOR74626.1 hypothetical protein IMZ16_04115 [Cruoricaptor ignavus]